VTQCGVRRMPTFFSDNDYRLYLELMAHHCRAAGVEIWAYCLMPNHVHLLAMPHSADALARGIGEAHRRYTCEINGRNHWRGYLWQGRFASFPMDEHYLLAAVRHIENNPLRAGLVEHPADYRWSSARAHFLGEDDLLVHVAPLLELVGDWGELLAAESDDEIGAVRRHARTGRPLGSRAFIDQLCGEIGRELHKKRPGPKPRAE